MNFKELALKEGSYILEQRRWLHVHPELGTKEYKTTEHIVNELKILPAASALSAESSPDAR